jgi:Cu/Zn superoxide dismutase
MPRATAVVSAAAALAALASCASAPDVAVPSSVSVRLQPVRGTTAAGEATLVRASGGMVRVAARFTGLRERWSYTFFVAERADCAGSEPGGARTIPLAGALRTVSGALPALVSAADGTAEIALQVRGSLDPRSGDFAGRALVLQPDGYGRAACGGVPGG